MLVFSATSLAASVLCWLVTPETLGRSLSQRMAERGDGGGVELRDGTKV